VTATAARYLAAAALAVLAGCAGSAPAVSPPPEVLASPAASAPVPLKVHDPGKVTGTLAGKHCVARGTTPEQLPDPACTPGAYDPAVTAGVLCARDSRGHYTYDTDTYRPPVYQTSRFKAEQALPAYGLAPGTRAELDHLIPLVLGGANDAANLWPQPPPPGKPIAPNVKDRSEVALRTWTCQGTSAAERQGRLDTARQVIADNWITSLAVAGVPARDVTGAA